MIRFPTTAAPLICFVLVACLGCDAKTTERNDPDGSMEGTSTRPGTGGADATTPAEGRDGGGDKSSDVVACRDTKTEYAAPRCRTADDCTGQWLCSNDPTVRVIGCGFPPASSCELDSDCAETEVCKSSSDGFCHSYRSCKARCAKDSCNNDEFCADDGYCTAVSCEAGHMCPAGNECAPGPNADRHGCRALRCDEGKFECEKPLHCDPSPGSDPHGCNVESCTAGFECPENTRCVAGSAAPNECEAVGCKSDTACDCGYCIDGHCASNLLYCSSPAVP